MFINNHLATNIQLKQIRNVYNIHPLLQTQHGGNF